MVSCLLSISRCTFQSSRYACFIYHIVKFIPPERKVIQAAVLKEIVIGYAF